MGSLRRRLFAAIALTVLLSIGVTVLVGALLVRGAVRDAALEELARKADLLAQREREAPAPSNRLSELGVYLASADERVAILSLPQAALLLPFDDGQQLRAGRSVEGTVDIRGREHLFAARPAGARAVVLLRPASIGFSEWRPFFGGLLAAGVLGAALAALVSYLLARAIARPIKRVADASAALAAGAAPPALPVEGSREVAGLARAFNDMAEQLERASRAQRSFLLSVSHELKTPLTAIRGYAEGLVDDAVSPEEAAEVIRLEAERLERLVRDLLDLARLDQRSFSVRRAAVDLAEVARETVRRYEPQARSFGVALRIAGPPEAPAQADPDRVLQVLSNLVENALRLTPAGGSVTVTAAPGALTVEDGGPGLASDDLPRAFERFFLYDRYGRERAVGSGLGLAIVKELTEAMGGTVHVHSSPGDGARFSVRLPAGVASSKMIGAT